MFKAVQSPDTNYKMPNWTERRIGLHLESLKTHGPHQKIFKFMDPSQKGGLKILIHGVSQILSCLPAKSPAIRLFRGGWRAIHYFTLEQVYRNQFISDTYYSKDLVYRRYNQMPCTPETLARRIAKIEKHISRHEPILIVGDDDLQSIELARRGYTDITVIEIDHDIIKTIKKSCLAQNLHINLVHAPVESVALEYRDEYKAILMDPPSGYEGFKLFFMSALRLVEKPEDALLFLNTNLILYQEDGYKKLAHDINQRYGTVIECVPGFSAYPIPKIPRFIYNWLLKLAVSDIYGEPLKFFVSDFVLCKLKKAHTQLHSLSGQ
jgi:hypothetical protein